MSKAKNRKKSTQSKGAPIPPMQPVTQSTTPSKTPEDPESVKEQATKEK